MRRTALALTAALLFVPAAAFAGPPPALIASTERTVSAAANDGWTPEEAADPANVPPRMRKAPGAMFRKVDINGDAYPDWQVSYEKAPNPTAFCGTGGCAIELWAGQPDGTLKKVFDAMVREFAIKGPKTGRYVDVDFHGSVCGTYGSQECPRRYGWDPASGGFQPRPNIKGQGVLVFGPAQVVKLDPDTAPAAIRAQLDRRAAVCRQAGGDYDRDESTFLEIPDINGDGVPDWVVGAYDLCNYGDAAPPEPPPALPVTVLVSGPDGLTTALEMQDIVWQIDIAVTPAAFVVVTPNDDCVLEDGNCPRARLEFGDGAARLVSENP